jgi:hypothetical protein
MATVLFHSCWLDDHIPASGWTTPHATTKAEATNLTFAEFNSTGPGAKVSIFFTVFCRALCLLIVPCRAVVLYSILML